MSTRKAWNEAMETISRDEMETIRLEKLKRLLKHSYLNSEFYKKRFDQVGFKPEDIKSWDDFRKLPVLMNKDDERTSQDESIERFGHPFGTRLCVPPEKIIMSKTTTGTTGTPTFSYSFTKNDLERWNECSTRALWLAGVRPGDRVLYCVPLSGGGGSSGGMTGGAFAYMGALPIEVGTEPPMERIFLFARLANTNTLLATPSFADTMTEKCKEMTGKEIRELGLKKLLLTGEPGIGIPAIRRRIEKAFGGRWSEWIQGNAEGHGASCEAQEYQGLHEVAPELCICCEDLVNPLTKEPIEVKDGAIGEPLITSLDREGAPFIKYALGDIFQVFTRPCECSYPGPGYRKRILGRVDDMLIIEGVYILPLAIKEVIGSFIPRLTGEMRIILTQRPPRISPPLKIKAEYGKGVGKGQLEGLSKEIKGKIYETYKVMSDIELLPPETLERAPWKTPIFEKRYE